MRIILITCVLFLVSKHILNVDIRFSNIHLYCNTEIPHDQILPHDNIFPQTTFEGEHYLAAESSVAAHTDNRSHLETGPIYVYNFNY